MADMVTYPLNKIEYQATDAELFHSTRTSGVYSGDDFSMSVTGANNIVTFMPGIAWIRNGKFSGKVVASKSAVSVDLGVANASLPRWDVVCIQFDKNKNATDIVAKTGVAASSPVMPAISQTETLYELYLCKVYRPAGSATITAGNVYDLRLDETVCGLMADSVTRIDTRAIRLQIDSMINSLNAKLEDVEAIDHAAFTATGTAGVSVTIQKSEYVKVPLTTITGKTNKYFHLTNNGTIQIDVTGYYMISASVNVQVNKADANVYSTISCFVNKNGEPSADNELISGSDKLYITTDTSGGRNTRVPTGAKVVYLQAGDYLTLSARAEETTGTLYYGNPATYLTVMRISN